jgi:hypothetical protein
MIEILRVLAEGTGTAPQQIDLCPTTVIRHAPTGHERLRVADRIQPLRQLFHA